MPYLYDSQEEHFMKEHDMVFSKSKDGTITGGGFAIDSMLLKNITQYGEYPNENVDNMIGGDNPHKNMNKMAVPFGLFYKKEKMLQKSLYNSKKETDTDVNDDNEISDDIYDQLLKKVNANGDSSEKSKKSGNSEKKKSRKNKGKLTKPDTNHKKTAKSSLV